MTVAGSSGSGRPAELDGAWQRLGRPPGSPLLAERELDFEA